MVQYLIGRYADMVFGMATGTFAYYLWEREPSNPPCQPGGRTLVDLVQWKIRGGAPPGHAQAQELLQRK